MKANFVRVRVMGPSMLLTRICQKYVHPKLFTKLHSTNINSEVRTMMLSKIETILYGQNDPSRTLSQTCCYLEESEEELMLQIQPAY